MLIILPTCSVCKWEWRCQSSETWWQIIISGRAISTMLVRMLALGSLSYYVRNPGTQSYPAEAPWKCSRGLFHLDPAPKPPPLPGSRHVSRSASLYLPDESTHQLHETQWPPPMSWLTEESPSWSLPDFCPTKSPAGTKLLFWAVLECWWQDLSTCIFHCVLCELLTLELNFLMSTCLSFLAA